MPVGSIAGMLKLMPQAVAAFGQFSLNAMMQTALAFLRVARQSVHHDR
jgi:hypothetical protein